MIAQIQLSMNNLGYMEKSAEVRATVCLPAKRRMRHPHTSLSEKPSDELIKGSIGHRICNSLYMKNSKSYSNRLESYDQTFNFLFYWTAI